MNLVLSREQKYINKVDHIQYQAWNVEDLNSLGNTFITTIDKLHIPTATSYHLYVQDVIGQPGVSFSELKLQTTIIYESQLQNWMSIPLEDLNRPITRNGLMIPFIVTPELSNITEGHHNAAIVFKIIGVKNGIETEVSSYSVNYSLRVFPKGNYYSPLSVELVRTKNYNILQAFAVDGNNYEVIAPPGVTFWKGTNNYSTNHYKGSGYALLRVEVQSDLLDTELSKVITVKYSNVTYSVLLNCLIFEDYYPEKMQFNVADGEIDKQIQRIYFKEEGDYQLLFPSWLQVKKLNSNQRYVEVILPSASNFGTGQFDDTISLQFQNRTINIPVTLNVFDGFNLGIRNGEILFAESIPILNFSTSSNSNHLEVDFILDDEDRNLFNFSYKVPFFQRKAEFSISDILRRQVIMQNYFSPNFTKRELPVLSLIIREMQGTSILKEYTKAISVLNGEKPVRTFDNLAILNADILERFTYKGIAVINVLSPGLFNYSIRINSVIKDRFENVPGVIKSVYLNFKKYGVKEGDMIEFVLHTTKGDLTKSFVITPPTTHSNVIFYRNKHGLVSSIECTGEVKIDVEKKRKLEKYSTNGEFKTRSYLEDSQEKLVINTGYIFADQISVVSDLLNSDQAFFYQNNERFMLVPNTEKLNKLNTENFLNQFSLEFLINDIDYAQVHF